jgi:hypothetical protein
LQLLLPLFPKISTSSKSSKHEIETQNFNIIKTSTTTTHNFNKIELRKPKTKQKSKPRISTKLNRIQKTKNETEIETHIFNKIKPRKTKLKTQKRIATEKFKPRIEICFNNPKSKLKPRNRSVEGEIDVVVGFDEDCA